MIGVELCLALDGEHSVAIVQHLEDGAEVSKSTKSMKQMVISWAAVIYSHRNGPILYSVRNNWLNILNSGPRTSLSWDAPARSQHAQRIMVKREAHTEPSG